MEEKYYVISCSEDGDIRIYEYTKENLLSMLKKDYKDCVTSENIKSNDPLYWSDSILIIKGKIVIPTEKKAVIEYDIE